MLLPVRLYWDRGDFWPRSCGRMGPGTQDGSWIVWVWRVHVVLRPIYGYWDRWHQWHIGMGFNVIHLSFALPGKYRDGKKAGAFFSIGVLGFNATWQQTTDPCVSSGSW